MENERENIDALKTALAEVKELDLSGSLSRPLLTKKQALPLAVSLKSNNTLTQLNLGNNEIGASGGTALADALARNKKLAEYRVKLGELQEPLSAACLIKI
jgi:Ran GTPase-activating protein (RanGAP) involved in mRNA processing and transport